MIDCNRFMIRTNRPDFAEMLRCWEWLIGRDKKPLVMTKFGDWFLEDAEGYVYWLDLLECTCKRVANSVPEFEAMMFQRDQLLEWFSLPWCYHLHDEGHVPGPDQCFGFKVPPRLGAPVDLSNVVVADLKAYQVWMAKVAKIPPGTALNQIADLDQLPS